MSFVNCRSTLCLFGGRSSVEVFRSTSCWLITVQLKRSRCVVRCPSPSVWRLRVQLLVLTHSTRRCRSTVSLCRRRRSLLRQILVPTNHSQPTWNQLHRHGNVLRRRRRQSRHGDRRGKHGVLCCVQRDTSEFSRRRTLHLQLTTCQLNGL